MPKVIAASGLSLVASHELTLSLDHPIVGWQSLTTGWTATFEDPNYPASNLDNPATHLKWMAVDQGSPAVNYYYLTSGLTNLDSPADSPVVDYVAIARHNLASIQCRIAIGYFDTASPTGFVTLIPDTLLLDDGPALFRFSAQALSNIAIRLNAFDTSSPPLTLLPEIAVAYAGKLLVLPRKVYQGLTPIESGRTAKVTNARSEAGQFLGRIVMQEFVKDTIPLSLVDPDYYLLYIDDFLAGSKEAPFFFAYRPQSHTESVGYCHMTNDPMPVNEAPHGLIAMQLEMTGIV